MVAAATGLTWRAVDGGVFSTSTGSAYDAWALASPEGQPLSLIRAAILAANADNTQHWIFTVSEDRIELYADLSRTIGAMDPSLREHRHPRSPPRDVRLSRSDERDGGGHCCASRDDRDCERDREVVAGSRHDETGAKSQVVVSPTSIADQP